MGFDGVPVFSSKAPRPSGHYSQAVEAGGFVFTATQLPLVIGKIPDPALEIGKQAAQVLENLKSILEAAGANLGDRVRVTVYVKKISDLEEINAVYGNFMGNHRPARGILEVSAIHFGFGVAMDAIAFKDSRRK